MKTAEIKATFEMLARSQGMYGRLLDNITDEGYAYLESMNFKDELDLILFIEQ